MKSLIRLSQGKFNISDAKSTSDILEESIISIEDAFKNLVRLPIVIGTLPLVHLGIFCGARVNIIPAAPGTGVIAGGAVRTVLEAVGVNDVLSKSQGSSNPHNVLKACVNGLMSQNSPKILSAIRGKKISDIVLKRETK